MRRFSSNSTTVLTIEYGMPIFIDMPNVQPSASALGSVLGVAHGARAVDVVMAVGVGEEVEDRLGRRGDHAFDGDDVSGIRHAARVPTGVSLLLSDPAAGRRGQATDSERGVVMADDRRGDL